MFRFFLVENVPSLNKGEMAIFEGILESFKFLGNVEGAMLSDHPEVDKPRYGHKAKIIDINKHLYLSHELSHYNILFKTVISIFFICQHLIFLILYKVYGFKVLKLMKSEIWKEYLESDVILIGHDSAFGLGGGIGSIIIFYPFFIPFFSKAINKPVVFYGGSIGRPKRYRQFHWFIKTGTKLALNRMDLITLRENISYRNMKDIGVRNDMVFVTADPAFLLQPEDEWQIKEILRREGIDKDSRPIIGMTITQEITSLAFSGSDITSNYYIKVIAEVIDEVTNRLNATVIFIPHCIGFGEYLDDRIIAKDIFRICKNKDKVKVIMNEYTPRELKGLIGQFDLFVGERTHSVINAMSMNVPSIIVSTSSDQRLDIIRMLGQENAIYYAENLNSKSLLFKINDFWLRKDNIKEELQTQVKIMTDRAGFNGKVLREILNSYG